VFAGSNQVIFSQMILPGLPPKIVRFSIHGQAVSDSFNTLLSQTRFGMDRRPGHKIFLTVSEHNETGKKGEDLATEFLEDNGYHILRRNYTFRRCEIDIIALRGDWLLFVEVKTRSSLKFGHPEEFVDGAKAARIMHAAEEFIYSLNWHGHIRFDIISVQLGAKTEIDHFEDAIS
jgi:putative endonuclease